MGNYVVRPGSIYIFSPQAYVERVQLLAYLLLKKKIKIVRRCICIIFEVLELFYIFILKIN